ncbi:glycosyl hydrolase 115 family protein [Pontiella agarivorans]|uniref:Glycosyl hydrolase 115 family protein n=1 Tax=Pontiella agarivorans TaxID=3038953 RepID=A0ABU5MTM0_9BACT|nr:glycosyl hydrolase 115 family protein [Pontiella agarivorans]MDZ8117540.1 glycosyl hydrolase 115 family protein [Pontiella agarivorans]
MKWILPIFGIVAASRVFGLTLTANVDLRDESGSEAVDYAVTAFEKDLQRKLGFPVPGEATGHFTFRISRDWKAFDRHRIKVSDSGVTITGSDELGLIHGIYSFSEDVLGIDPCIYFTGIVPERVRTLDVPNGLTESKPYTFTHRAMFVNDEDLIIGFQMENQSYGMNPEFMEKLYETMLRLKMTGVIPSTLVLADEPHLVLASDMGLYINQHHAEPLGSVPLYWPKNIPYSWSTHREHFIDFWSDAIKRQKGRNVIWTLNFRGLLDRAFWDDDPAMSRKSSMEEKARVVNDVIRTQYELLKELTGEEHPLICGYLWGELSRLYSSGLLEYPEDTMLLFSDSGHGVMGDWNWKLAEKCDLKMGIYQHVSYHNRKTHMRINAIHPDTFQHEVGRAVEYGMTNAIVLNVGNFKEKIFGIRQMATYMNHFEEFQSCENGDWYFDWYAKHVLGTTQPAVADSYRDFFACPFLFSKDRKNSGDEYFFYYVEQMLNGAYQNEVDRKLMRQDLFSSSEEKWEVALERAYDCRRFLAGNVLDFYEADLVGPTLKMRHLTGMAVDFTASLEHYLNKEWHKAQLDAYQALLHVREALKAEEWIEQSGWGRFEGWYDHDETARTWHIERLLEHYIDHLKDLNYFNLDYSARNPKTPGLDYKYQPYFESEYRDELIWMTNGE